MKILIILLLSLWSLAGLYLYLSMFELTNQVKPWKSVVNVIICGPAIITFSVLILAIAALSEACGWFSRKYRTWLFN